MLIALEVTGTAVILQPKVNTATKVRFTVVSLTDAVYCFLFYKLNSWYCLLVSLFGSFSINVLSKVFSMLCREVL